MTDQDHVSGCGATRSAGEDRSSRSAVAVAAVARTLRFAAFLLQDEYGGCDPTVVEPTGWAEHWRSAAAQLEAMGLDADGRPDDGGCCVICQEVACDGGCPLAEVRR